MRMKTIRQYTEKEIQDLTTKYNALVKQEYKTDTSGMVYLLTEANTDQNLVNPYYEISKSATVSKHTEIFCLEWQYKYVVSIFNGGEQFFADENNESCDGSQDHFINDFATAKKVYNLNNNGRIELREYNGSEDWEYYIIWAEK